MSLAAEIRSFSIQMNWFESDRNRFLRKYGQNCHFTSCPSFLRNQLIFNSFKLEMIQFLLLLD